MRSTKSRLRCRLLFLERRSDGRGNGSVYTLELSADQSHPGNAHHRNQSANQAILNDCNAGFVFDETSKKISHSPLSKKAKLRGADHSPGASMISLQTLHVA
jgi:hypothetical protein